MSALLRQGAFQGGSERDAYFVKRDLSTNAQADLDNGVVNTVVGYARINPAEFVIVRIRQAAGRRSDAA